MNIRFTALLLILFFTATLAQAQRYGTAVGLRFGNSNLYRTIGLSAQQRITKRLSIEGIVQSDFKLNTTFSALMEKHHPIISKRFNYYYGAGPSFGVEESFVKEPESQQIIHTYGNATFGLDLLAGLELTLLNTVISLDYKPNVNMTGRQEFYRGQMGISARMVLVKSKEQKKRQRQRQRAKKKADKTPLTEQIKVVFGPKN